MHFRRQNYRRRPRRHQSAFVYLTIMLVVALGLKGWQLFSEDYLDLTFLLELRDEWKETLLDSTPIILGIVLTFIVWQLVRGARTSSRVLSGSELRYNHNNKPKHSVSSAVRPVVEYWRQSLADGARMSLSEREIEGSGTGIPWEQIRGGKLGSDAVAALQRQSSGQRERNGGTGDKSGGSIQILVAPIKLCRDARRGISNSDFPSTIIPYWIPAAVNAEGKLSAIGKETPWIPRTYLEPVAIGSELIFGDTVVAEQFVTDNPITQVLSWDDYLDYAERLFKAVCGVRLDSFVLEGYTLSGEATAIPYDGGNWSASIERLYNDILDGRAATGLTSVIAKIHTEPRRRKTLAGRGVLNAAIKHCGQFGSSFPLSPSQRRAVHETLVLGRGEVLAVTGPPGTGKTTLIQSIIASMWVIEARRSGAKPPLIVCCSATNQATTNIIDSFSRAGSDSGALAGRWLPEFSSFGTFCSSESRARAPISVPFTLLSGGGTLADFEREDYLARAEAHFLSCYSTAFSPEKSVARAMTRLQKELFRAFGEVYQAAYSGYDGGSTTQWLKQALGLSPTPGEPEFFPLLEKLDTTTRFRAFQLATHYWEARWLLELPELIERRKQLTRSGKLRLEKEYWQIRAMLTPCFVSTFSMAPEFFGGQTATSGPPIDLLVVDEAGQVTPENGAAAFALANRAVVIGDTAQLEPVWCVPRHTDDGNLLRFEVAKNAADIRNAHQLGITASSGSLMQRALTTSAVEENGVPGVFLSEHRRSVPAIVEFINTLSYNQQLQPMRSEPSERILPAFGYAHIRGKSVQSGRSRLNRIEAEAIVGWIRAHQRDLEAWYRLPLAEILAVITPFTSQTLYLKSMLLDRYPSMVIGTVGSLQGAERPVVVFSPVYDHSQPFNFAFDRTPNLLNVAVSRAKDSLLVFGDMESFRRGGKLPSTVLASFLFADNANELTDIEPEPMTKPGETTSGRLSTPEEHERALTQAFQTASNRILIVAPSISADAIASARIEQHIAEAVAREISVTIYTDADLDIDSATGNLRESAEEGRAHLARAGASVVVAERVHSKALAIDDTDIFQGHYSWLSSAGALRAGGKKHPVSAHFTGAEAQAAIEQLEEDLSSRTVGAAS